MPATSATANVTKLPTESHAHAVPPSSSPMINSPTESRISADPA